MPLEKSPSKKAREVNIHREIEAGKPIDQAVAIGYSEQREAEKHEHEDKRQKEKRESLEKEHKRGEKMDYGHRG